MAELRTAPSLPKRDEYAADVAAGAAPWFVAATAAAASAPPPTSAAAAMATRVFMGLFPYRRARALMDASFVHDCVLHGRRARFARPGKTVRASGVLGSRWTARLYPWLRDCPDRPCPGQRSAGT